MKKSKLRELVSLLLKATDCTTHKSTKSTVRRFVIRKCVIELAKELDVPYNRKSYYNGKGIRPNTKENWWI